MTNPFTFVQPIDESPMDDGITEKDAIEINKKLSQVILTITDQKFSGLSGCQYCGSTSEPEEDTVKHYGHCVFKTAEWLQDWANISLWKTVR